MHRSGHGLEKRAVMVRLPAEARAFCLLLCVHTGSGAHPATYLENTGVCSLFWDVTQHRLAVTCRLFAKTHRSHFQVSSSPERILSRWWSSRSVKLTTIFHLMSRLRMRMLHRRLHAGLRDRFYLPPVWKYSTPLSWKHDSFVGSLWFLALTRPLAAYGVDRLVLLLEAQNVCSVSQRILFPIIIQMVIILSAVT